MQRLHRRSTDGSLWLPRGLHTVLSALVADRRTVMASIHRLPAVQSLSSQLIKAMLRQGGDHLCTRQQLAQSSLWVEHGDIDRCETLMQVGETFMQLRYPSAQHAVVC